jgi:hypothetical protein
MLAGCCPDWERTLRQIFRSCNRKETLAAVRENDPHPALRVSRRSTARKRDNSFSQGDVPESRIVRADFALRQEQNQACGKLEKLEQRTRWSVVSFTNPDEGEGKC